MTWLTPHLVIAPGFSSQTAGNPTGFWLGWGMTSWIMKRGIWTAILHPSQLSDSWSSEMCRRLAAGKPRGVVSKAQELLGAVYHKITEVLGPFMMRSYLSWTSEWHSNYCKKPSTDLFFLSKDPQKQLVPFDFFFLHVGVELVLNHFPGTPAWCQCHWRLAACGITFGGWIGKWPCLAKVVKWVI